MFKARISFHNNVAARYLQKVQLALPFPAKVLAAIRGRFETRACLRSCRGQTEWWYALTREARERARYTYMYIYIYMVTPLPRSTPNLF